jgi:signal transduction histidine kinase
VDADAGLPSLDLDPLRMKQVLTNLVENAIRAMPDGGSILLAARVDGDSLVIEVTDDGPGIAPELRSTLFDRFTKSAGSRGSGLGLAIARAIVTAHGGSIDASSGPEGKGTTLRISLPRSAAT